MNQVSYRQLLSAMDALPTEEKIRRLNLIIDNELEKPEQEADTQLILECTEYLQDLLPQSEQPSRQELDRIYQAITAAPAKAARRKRKRIILRTAAILAAAFLLLFGALSVAAAIQGYANAAELINAKINEWFDMKPGETAQFGKYTVIKAGSSTEYASAEEFVTAEQLPILVPEGLQGKLRPERVLIFDADKEGHFQIDFVFKNPRHSIYVTNQYTFSDLSAIKEVTVYTTPAGYDFYVLKPSDDFYQSMCQTDGYEYVVTAPDEASLQELMNSLQKVS